MCFPFYGSDRGELLISRCCYGVWETDTTEKLHVKLKGLRPYLPIPDETLLATDNLYNCLYTAVLLHKL